MAENWPLDLETWRLLVTLRKCCIAGTTGMRAWQDRRENKRRGRGASTHILPTQASTAVANWSTSVTQVDIEANFPFTMVTELRTKE